MAPSLPLSLKNMDDSDSEDPDYIPPEGEPDVDSESGTPEDDQSADAHEKKRVRLDTETQSTHESAESKKKAREALWNSFQASLCIPDPSSSTAANPRPLVKIQKKFRFAGEEITKVLEVPEDSLEASKWPRWQPETETVSSSVSAAPPTVSSSMASSEPSSSSKPASVRPLQNPSDDSTSFTVSSDPPAPASTAPTRSGPRRPKTVLAPLPSQKSTAQKLTTLDKSAMDWRAHVAASEANTEELEAHRRSGGYLDKVDFLKRVDERREEVLQSSKDKGKRRRI